MSIVERFRGLGAVLGMMFSGNRDLYEVFGYKRQVTYLEMLGKYRRQDIATRIVEAEPRATWSAPPQALGDEVFMKAWADLIAGHNIHESFNRLDKLLGIGRYAVLVVGMDDGMSLDAPIQPVSGAASPERKLLYLQPYSELSAAIIEYDTNQNSPRYGLPTKYRITPNKIEKPTSGLPSLLFKAPHFDVHHTRILHVSEGGLEDNILGTPRLEKVYNLLDDILKTVGGSAETFWLTSNRGMQVDVDKEMELLEADAQALEEEIEEYIHNLRRVIRTKGVTVNSLGSDVADPRGTFSVLTSLLSGATGIPQRILFGSEAGQLASEQDRANWAARIEERRVLFAEPMILNPFVKMMVAATVLPAPTSLVWKWPDAFKMSPLERAQAAAQKARTLANTAKALEATDPVITKEEARSMIGLDEVNPIFDEPSDTLPGSPSA